MTFSNPAPDEIRDLLQRVKHIALVGYSPNPGRPSHNIGRMMQRYGFRITPVRPGIAEGLGEKAYPDLASIPDPGGIDMVDVFRASEHVDGIVDECLRLGYKAIWLQDGVIDEASAARAVAGGMTVVMDRCILRDYTRMVAAA
jgi:predicted CoA-binding protein